MEKKHLESAVYILPLCKLLSYNKTIKVLEGIAEPIISLLNEQREHQRHGGSREKTICRPTIQMTVRKYKPTAH